MARRKIRIECRSNNVSLLNVKYSEDVDILIIELAHSAIDYAERKGNVIVHFDKKDEPVALEVLHGQAFLKTMNKALPKALRQQLINA